MGVSQAESAISCPAGPGSSDWTGEGRQTLRRWEGEDRCNSVKWLAPFPFPILFYPTILSFFCSRLLQSLPITLVFAALQSLCIYPTLAITDSYIMRRMRPPLRSA